jgi:hypothetical protein
LTRLLRLSASTRHPQRIKLCHRGAGADGDVARYPDVLAGDVFLAVVILVVEGFLEAA